MRGEAPPADGMPSRTAMPRAPASSVRIFPSSSGTASSRTARRTRPAMRAAAADWCSSTSDIARIARGSWVSSMTRGLCSTGGSRIERKASGRLASGRRQARRPPGGLGLLGDLCAGARGRGRGRRERLAANQGGDLLAVQHLALEQRLGDPLQAVAVLLEDALGGVVAGDHDRLDLVIDLDRGRLRVVPVLRDLPAEEDLLFFL